jgi:hypothetical protein
MDTSCKNCNFSYNGNYCSNCGQSVDTHEINFDFIVHEIQHGIVHIDKGFLFTVKQLLLRPGHAIREFIEGKRVKHFKPITFVLLVSTLYALLSHFVHEDTFIDSFLSGFLSVKDHDASSNIASKNILKPALWFKEHYAYTSLLMLPFVSMATYLIFKKQKYNYFQHLILNAYITGQRTLYYVLFIPIMMLFNEGMIKDTLVYIKLFIGIAFSVFVYTQFFNKNSIRKNILLGLMSQLFQLLLVLVAFIFYLIIVKVFSLLLSH